MTRTFAACAVLILTTIAFGQSTRPTTAPAAPTTVAAPPTSAPAAFVPVGPAAIIEIRGGINDFSAGVFEKHVAAARASGVKTVLLRLNTPGGAVHSAMRMSRLIKQSRADMRIIAVVDEMALSAGALLALACDRVVMEPNSMIGDCAPIIVGPNGLQTLGEAERAKAESPILAEFRDSAERSGYDPLMATAMVQYGIVVHYLQGPDGTRQFADQARAKTLREQGWATVAGVPDPLDGPNQLLTVGNTLAQTIGLSVATVASAEAYAASLNLPVVGTYATTFGENAVGLLSDPTLRSFLGIIFLWSLYISISKPGTGGAEVLAVLSGAMLIGVPLLTGYAGLLEVALILLGILLLAVELFVIPGFGVAGISGLVCLLVGLVLTYAPPELPGGGVLPSLQGTRTALKHGLIAVTAGLVMSMLLWVWLARYLPKIPYMGRLVLTTDVGTAPEPDDALAAVDQAWPAVGDTGTALTPLMPGGVARFLDPITADQRSIDVVSDVGYVEPGDSVVVREHRGNRVVVRPTQAAV